MKTTFDISPGNIGILASRSVVCNREPNSLIDEQKYLQERMNVLWITEKQSLALILSSKVHFHSSRSWILCFCNGMIGYINCDRIKSL